MRAATTLLRAGMTGNSAALGTPHTRRGTDGSSSRGGGTLLVRRRVSYDSKGRARAIYNHDELRGALKRWLDARAPRAERPLVVFEPSGLSFAETVRLWSSASLVVAPHGAGLANLMFCPPGATVVELFRAGDPHVIYQRLSATFDLHYVGCQHGPRRAGEDTGTSNFVLNLTWFFEVCLRGHGIRHE